MALGEPNLEARALWGLWNANQSAGQPRSALSFAKRFAALAVDSAQDSDVPVDLILGNRIAAIALHYTGEQNKAQAILDRFLPHANGIRQRLPLGRSVNQRAVGNATLARVLWTRGERVEALQLAASCASQACGQMQALDACYVLIEATIPLELLSKRRKEASGAIEALRNIAARMGLRVAQACSRAFEQYLASLDDQSPARLQDFATALSDLAQLEFSRLMRCWPDNIARAR